MRGHLTNPSLTPDRRGLPPGRVDHPPAAGTLRGDVCRTGPGRAGFFRTLCCACGLLLGSAAPTLAATYYVASTGDDANAGTVDAPFRTVQRGLDAVHPGDTCLVGPGTYTEALGLKTSGTSQAPITLKGSVPGAATISSGDLRAVMLWGNIGYYTFDGLNFVSNFVGPYAGDKDYSIDLGIGNSWWGWDDPNSGNNGFLIQNCNITGSVGMIGSHNTIRNCTFNGNNQFTKAIHDMTASSHDNLYTNNLIHDYAHRAVWTMFNTSNITISYNTIYNIGSRGASLDGCAIDLDGVWIPIYNSEVSHNTIWLSGMGIEFENGMNCIGDGNVVHEVGMGMGAINYTWPDAEREYRGTSTGSIFRNNVIYNTTSSGLIAMSSPGNSFYNNTVHNNSAGFAGIVLANQGTSFNSNNSSVVNNIVTDSNLSLLIDPGTTGSTISNNLYYNSGGNTATHKWNGTYTLAQFQSSFGLEGYSSYGDPLYANAAAGNFTLRGSSPGIDTGAALPGVPNDFSGIARPQGGGYDRGAFEAHSADQVLPTVGITSPTGGAIVSGKVEVRADAADDTGVTRLEFYLNGGLLATLVTPPYVFSWNTASLSSGAYRLSATAYDAGGNAGHSAEVAVTVTGDSLAPAVSVTEPADNSTVSGVVRVTAQATDNTGVSRIETYVNGVLAGVSNLNPATYSWDTSQAPGSSTLYARAYDAANNAGESAYVNVTVAKTAVKVPAGNIPHAGWKLRYVDSQETTGEPAGGVNSFDGNTNSMWHTQWYNVVPPPCPHEIQINLGKVYTLTGFSYLPRQDGGINGTIARYEFYVSRDGWNWGVPAAKGTFSADTRLKQVSFPAAAGQYIRLRALSEVNGGPWTSVGEIDATGY